MKVMVLAGGPDREREVSLRSGEQVAQALREAGHEVLVRDVLPGALGVLDEFSRWGGDVIFPALHGPWGEGGGLQAILDERGLAYVGSRAPAARCAMDKHEAKRILAEAGITVPHGERITLPGKPNLPPPVVLKPVDEGSSIGVKLCPDAESLALALEQLGDEYQQLLVERMIRGIELTVGVLGTGGGHRWLPPIQIVSVTAFFDYQAKYLRDDTRHLFDIDLDVAVLTAIGEQSVKAHEALGCRHLSRVDWIVEPAGTAYCLEVNTLPGFTSKSLLPEAAARSGLAFPELVDHLVCQAAAEPATA
ncbi:MAG: D-alanine--D-alanine ligase [Phycisphaeraceae bacterium]|nr:D-alanine--D-alanine ligase [Phycisphaeraceae bacterium]